MSRAGQIFFWIAAMVVVAMVVARYPVIVGFGIYATVAACLYSLIRRYRTTRKLPKFSLREILWLLGLVGCYFAFAKQGDPWQYVHSFPGHCLNITMSPDGSLVATNQGTSIEIRETQTGKHRKTLEMPPAEASVKANAGLWYHAFGFSQDNQTLLTVGWRDEVHLYDWQDASSIRSWDKVGMNPQMSRSGTRFAGCQRDGDQRIYRVYEANREEPLFQRELKRWLGTSYLQLSDTGKYVALASGNKTLEVWDVDANVRRFVIPDTPTRLGIALTQFSRDEKLLAVPTAKGISIWDIEKSKQVGEWQPPGFAYVASLEWSPDGTRLLATYIERTGPSLPPNTLATSANANTIHHCYLLDNKGEEISRVVGYSATFSPSGDRIATVYGSCNILDGRTGEMLTRIRGSNPRPSSIVRSFFFSPDGEWLFTNGGMATVFRRTRSERWSSVLSVPSYWGVVIFYVLLVREGVMSVWATPSHS